MNFSVAAGLSSLAKVGAGLLPPDAQRAAAVAGSKAIERLHPVIVNNKSKYIPEAMALVKYLVTPANLYWITVNNGYPVIPYTNFGEIIPAYAKYLKTIWLKGYEETNYVGEFQILGNYTYAYARAREHHLFQPRKGRFGQRHRHAGAAGRSAAGVGRITLVTTPHLVRLTWQAVAERAPLGHCC